MLFRMLLQQLKRMMDALDSKKVPIPEFDPLSPWMKELETRVSQLAVDERDVTALCNFSALASPLLQVLQERRVNVVKESLNPFNETQEFVPDYLRPFVD